MLSSVGLLILGLLSSTQSQIRDVKLNFSAKKTVKDILFSSFREQLFRFQGFSDKLAKI